MSFTGNPLHIQGLLDNESWTGTTGQAATITYSFNLPITDSFASNEQVFTGALQTAVQNAFARYSEVANLTFTNIDNGASIPNASAVDFAFSSANIGNAAGYVLADVSGTTLQSIELFMNKTLESSGVGVGSYWFYVLLHEIGHGLGLKHPHEGNPIIPAADDDLESTVMTYDDEGTYLGISKDFYPTGPMIYDIAALQVLYGANTSHNAGNTTHIIDGSKNAYTIWDASGDDDMLNTSSVNSATTIDLREGIDNVTIASNAAIWIAFGADIENAQAGAGSDRIFGNDLHNDLFGAAGNDSILGFEGNDFIQANQGQDSLLGGAGEDMVRGGKDNDYVQGNSGNDHVFGDNGNDVIHGGKDNDYVQGNIGDDLVFGDLGNDIVRGGQGNDTLFGGSGTDDLFGDRGNDHLYGGTDADIFHFNAATTGVDTIHDFVGGQDRIALAGTNFTTAAEAVANVTYDGANATLHLGNDNVVVIIGVAEGGIVESMFV